MGLSIKKKGEQELVENLDHLTEPYCTTSNDVEHWLYNYTDTLYRFEQTSNLW